MTILLFEDKQVSQLDPVALGKPAFAICMGGYRLIDLLAEKGHPIRASVRPHLQAVVEADFADVLTDDGPLEGPVLLVNARLVPAVAVVKQVAELLSRGRTIMVCQGEAVAAAVLMPVAGKLPLHLDGGVSPSALSRLELEPIDTEMPLIDYPHEIIKYHLAIFADNLAHRLAGSEHREIAEGVFAAPGASLGEHVVADTRAGPVVLETGASVGPHCFLRGPVQLGERAKVVEHAAVKDGVYAGHTTKIGGEVEASIVEPYTNKQHYGFLGHSYLGSWVNLGAGTCNSDLKNTYGPVNMEYRGRKVATGMQFVGAVIGDYTKTAINTGIFTGKIIGACSMVYGFVTTNVPSFVNYARLFSQVSEAPVEVLVATQRRMFARRGVEQRPCDIQLLHDMHRLTAHERQTAGSPMSVEPLSL